MLVKEITPVLHRLQEAFLVYEDQYDGEWDRSWYRFEEMFPETNPEPGGPRGSADPVDEAIRLSQCEVYPGNGQVLFPPPNQGNT